MIKLKDLLYEISSLSLLIPRRVEGRVAKYIQLKIIAYEKNNNVGDFDISRLGLTALPASLKHLKIGGVWKQAIMYVKIAGTWKTTTPYVKVAGVWK